MSYKALIVDDEPFIRYGLASTVDWAGAGFELAGEAGNGEQALQLVEERAIDVLITDIKMPKLDGLELVRLAKRSRPHLKAILISSYSDFDYARQAVQLGVVVDYLLKPTMEPEDVTRLLRLCRSKLDEEQAMSELTERLDRGERERRRHGFEAEMHRALSGLPADMVSYAAEMPGPYVLTVWRLEGKDPGAAERMAEQLSALLPDGALCALGERELALLLQDRPAAATAFGHADADPVASTLADAGSAAERVRRAHAALAGIAASASGDAGPATVGISPAFHRLSRLTEALEWARGAFDEAFFGGGGRCYDGAIRRSVRKEASEWAARPEDSERSGEEPEASARAAVLIQRLAARLADSDEEACERTLRQLFELWRSRALPPEEIRRQAGELLVRFVSGMLYLKAEEKLELLMEHRERLRRAVALDEVERLVTGSFEDAKEHGEPLPAAVTSAEDAGNGHAIQVAIAYIQEHYRKDISLREVADTVHMSRNYFSEQFKKRTGLNFIDYVIRLRIRYARHLLETTTLKVLDVGLYSGFNSSKHFLKMFKRETGCTPVEYRLRAQQGEGGAS